MKKFLTILIVMIMLVSAIGITTAFAGASITGSTSVVAGRSYNYTGKASYNGASLLGTINGLGVSGILSVDASSTTNRSISDSATIKVKIPSNANIGDTFSIKLTGSYSYFDEGGNLREQSFSSTKTLTVGLPPTPDPNSTAKPLEGWELVAEAMFQADDGTVVEAAMKGDYKIPESILAEMIERKIKLVIDFGPYKCTIDPAKLTDIEDIKSLDLSLMFEKVEGLSAIAGQKDLYQLHFGHSGELPGMLMFTFTATQNKPGDTVYLYYYYGEANVLEGKATAVVQENGMVSFEIYHCSSYFVTGEILPVAMSNFDAESAQALIEKTTELEAAQATIESTQNSLDDNVAKVTELTGKLTDVQSALDAELEKEPEVAKVTEPESKAVSVSLVVFIAALAAVLLLSVLLTMMFLKAGLFKRTNEKEAASWSQREVSAIEESRQQAKRKSMSAKQQAKQAAIDEKHQAKLDEMETKKQAKQDAIEMKLRLKQEAEQAKRMAKKAKKKGEDIDV